jgi:hypothetical protein
LERLFSSVSPLRRPASRGSPSEQPPDRSLADPAHANKTPPGPHWRRTLKNVSCSLFTMSKPGPPRGRPKGPNE